jgi:ribose transport system permease protein
MTSTPSIPQPAASQGAPAPSETARPPQKSPGGGHRVRRFLANNGALVGLVGLCLVLFIATPDFLTGQNLLNIGIQAATVSILAFGQTFVIVAAGIDLSVGSVAALSAMVPAVLVSGMGFPGWLSIPLGLLAGAVAGLVSGLSVAYGKLPAFIATLAMLSIARGLTLVISDGRPTGVDASVAFLGGNLGPIPVPILMIVVSGLVAAFILRKTVIGRYMYAVGGNTEAARISGIPVKRVLVVIFTLAGIFSALAGLVLAGRLDSAQPQAASGYELDSIAAVVIGGASLSGGVGRVSGTLVGAFVLVVIRNGLNLLNVSSFWQQVVIGLVIAIAVGIDVIRRKNTHH